MALLRVEGFEGAGATTGSGSSTTMRDYIKSRYRTTNALLETTNGSIRLVDGWGSGYALSWGGDATADNNFFDVTLNGEFQEVIVGFAYKPRFTTAGVTTLLHFFTGTQSESQIELRLYGNRNFICYNDTFNRRVDSWVPDALQTDRWSFIEIRMLMHASAGEIEIHVNGQTVLDLTGQDTRGDSGADYFDTIRFQGGEGASNTDVSEQFLIDDIYILDLTGSANNTFLGPIKVEALFPTAEGTTINFTPSAGSDNSANVDDNPKDDSTTYNSSSDTASNKDLFTTANLTEITDNIKGVQITSQAISAGGFPVGLQSIVLSSATQGTGAIVEVTSDVKYLSVQHIFETDPNTLAAWGVAGVNAMEIGYEID